MNPEDLKYLSHGFNFGEGHDPLGRKLTAHSFRHTFGTMMAQSVGSNPFIVKQLLGHSQISTTDRYCHPTPPAIVIDIAPYVSEMAENQDELWGTSMGNKSGRAVEKAV